MATKWMEGFEVDRTEQAVTDKYASVTFTQAAVFEAGRYHGYALGRVVGSGSSAIDFRIQTPVLGDDSTWVISLAQFCAYPVSVGGSNRVPGIILQRDGSTQLRADVLDYGDGNWYVSVTVGTVEILRTDPIQQATWHRLEMKVVLSHTNGSVEIRLDESTVASVSGVKTTSLVSALANQVEFVAHSQATTSSVYAIDDIVILNSTAETITFEGFTVSTADFIGDVAIGSMYVEAAGSNSAWTPNGASPNYACVDEADVRNGDTDYVSASGTAVIDEYATRWAQLAHGHMLGLQLGVHARIASAGLRTLKHSVRASSTRSADSGRDLTSTSYVYTWSVWSYNPVTGLAWTAEVLDGLEVGQELV